MCDFLERAVANLGVSDTQTQAMLLVPRGCFKSTIGTVALPMWLLKDNPNLRVLITSHHHEQSKQFLDEIKFNAVTSSEFLNLYGTWTIDATQWSDEAITIARTVAHHEPTIDTAGVDRTKTGGHYDLIIADDLHDEKNSDTETLRTRVYRHLQTLRPILEPNGVLLVVGTRWHAADLYGRIIGDEEKRKKELGDSYTPAWRILVKSSHNADGTLYFPTRITEKFLEQQKSVVDDKYYAVWYENRPLLQEHLAFPESWWRYFDGHFEADPIPLLHLQGGHERIPLYITMAIDPAQSTSNRSDYTAVTIVGCSPSNEWYIFEAERIRGGAVEALPYVAWCIRHYQPKLLSIETRGFQEMWKIWLMERISAMGLTVGVHEYTEENRQKKYFRIERLRPKFKAKQVLMARRLPNLYQELREYPEPAHDDVLDSLAQHIGISHPARDVTAIEDMLPRWEYPQQDQKSGMGLNTGLSSQKLRRE